MVRGESQTHCDTTVPGIRPQKPELQPPREEEAEPEEVT